MLALALLILLALASGVGIARFRRAAREARELAEEERWFEEYRRSIGWNDTGEVVE